jgi:hypothetical protein
MVCDRKKWFKRYKVCKDYKRTFKEETSKIIGLVIMIDTDGTKNGYAESFIGNIFFKKINLFLI